jgi:hypothetical protein
MTSFMTLLDLASRWKRTTLCDTGGRLHCQGVHQLLRYQLSLHPVELSTTILCFCGYKERNIPKDIKLLTGLTILLETTMLLVQQQPAAFATTGHDASLTHHTCSIANTKAVGQPEETYSANDDCTTRYCDLDVCASASL